MEKTYNFVKQLTEFNNDETLENINEFNTAFEDHLDLLGIDLNNENYSEESDTDETYHDDELTKRVYINLWHGGKSIISKAIMKQSNSRFSHASISLDKFGMPFYEMQLGIGFRIASYFSGLHLAFGKTGRKVEFFGIPSTQHQFDKYHNILDKYETNASEITYNMKHLFKIAFKIFQKKGMKEDSIAYLKKQDEFICSGFVLGILMQNDKNVLKYVRNHKRRWELYSPEELLNLPNLEQLHVIDFSKTKSNIKRQVDNFEKKNEIELN